MSGCDHRLRALEAELAEPQQAVRRRPLVDPGVGAARERDRRHRCSPFPAPPTASQHPARCIDMQAVGSGSWRIRANGEHGMKGGEIIVEALQAPEDPLRVRDLRPRQRRPARRAARGQGRHHPDRPPPRAGRGPHGGCLFPGQARAGRDAHVLRARLLQPRDGARGGAHQFLGAARDHRQCPDLAVQPQPVPGAQPPLPGGFSERAQARGQARLPAEPGRHAAAGAAPVDDRDAERTPGAGQSGRAFQPVPGGGRRGARGAGTRPQRPPECCFTRGRARGCGSAAAGGAAGAVHRPRRDLVRSVAGAHGARSGGPASR